MREAGIDRKWVGALALGCVLLTLVFIAHGFPYGALATRGVAALERSTGGHLEYANFRSVFGWAGPTLQWQDVVYRDPAGNQFAFDRVNVRAGWSLDWFAGTPVLHVELTGPDGRIAGLARGGAEPSFDGTLDQVDLEAIPSGWLGPQILVTGRVDGEVDVRVGPLRPAGTVRVQGRDGSLGGGPLNIGIPFDELVAHVSLGGEHHAQVETFHLKGPLLEADVTGTVGDAPTVHEAPLDLVAEINADAAMLHALEELGFGSLSAGASTLTITGTASSPKVR